MFTKKSIENQSETNVSARPKQLMIGYYSSIKRKDLETFLYSRAEGNMSLRSSYFNIIKYDATGGGVAPFEAEGIESRYQSFSDSTVSIITIPP